MVNELRFAITSEDFDTTVRLYRDILGLEQIADWGGDHGEGILLRVPAATLEILSKKHAAYVDRIEVGRATGARVRLAASVQEVDSLAPRRSKRQELESPTNRLGPRHGETVASASPLGMIFS